MGLTLSECVGERKPTVAAEQNMVSAELAEALFYEYDMDGDGFISFEDAVSYQLSLGRRVDAEERARELFQYFSFPPPPHPLAPPPFSPPPHPLTSPKNKGTNRSSSSSSRSSSSSSSSPSCSSSSRPSSRSSPFPFPPPLSPSEQSQVRISRSAFMQLLMQEEPGGRWTEDAIRDELLVLDRRYNKPIKAVRTRSRQVSQPEPLEKRDRWKDFLQNDHVLFVMKQQLVQTKQPLDDSFLVFEAVLITDEKTGKLSYDEHSPFTMYWMVRRRNEEQKALHMGNRREVKSLDGFLYGLRPHVEENADPSQKTSWPVLCFPLLPDRPIFLRFQKDNPSSPRAYMSIADPRRECELLYIILELERRISMPPLVHSVELRGEGGFREKISFVRQDPDWFG